MLSLAGTGSQVGASLQRRGRPAKSYKTFGATLREALHRKRAERKSVAYNDPRFYNDPALWARQICGVELWDKQLEILEAVRDHDRVSVRASQKVSKTHSAALLILWWWCTRLEARVVFTAPTFKQIQAVIYRQVLQLIAQTGLCADCKKADPHQLRPCPHSSVISESENIRIAMLAETGVQSTDFRSINGFTAHDTESLAGISGQNMLIVIDEASNVDEALYMALEGNLSAGGKMLAISNPTRNFNWFFESHHGKRAFWHTIHISSLDSPNYKLGYQHIPGLASRDTVERRKLEWGEQSAAYKIRVLGEFAIGEEGRAFSSGLIESAFERWPSTAAEGTLQIGVDPAGPSGLGDECGISITRGSKQLWFDTRSGLTATQTLEHVVALIEQYAQPGELAIVAFDREGTVGADVFGQAQAYLANNPRAFRLVGVRSSERIPKARNKPFLAVRDELFVSLHHWLEDGGALYPHPDLASRNKLAQEFSVIEWDEYLGKNVATSKKEIRKRIGRSCDRLDALSLSVWSPAWLHKGQAPTPPRAPSSQPSVYERAQQGQRSTFGPYASAFRRR